MDVSQLTTNSIQMMYNDNCPGDLKPTVQVIDVRKIAPQTPANGPTSERYRLVISDGQFWQQAMLATQLNHLANEELQQNCVTKLTEFICNTIHGRRIVIILGLEILSPPLEAQLGNPQPIDQNNQSQQNQQGNNNNNNNNVQLQNNNYQRQQNNYQNNNNYQDGQEDLSQLAMHPIKSLNPYQNKWVFKARVTNKGTMREWSNAKGSGKLFSVDLLDNQGTEIRATMFNDVAEKFNSVLEEGATYYFSKGSLKFANKKFTAIKNDYELTLNDSSIVQRAEDDNTIEKIKYDFVPIDAISKCAKDDIIDVLGIVTAVGEVTTIHLQRTNTDATKRVITIMDSSAISIELTLWGSAAENFDGSANPVVAIKATKVSEYNGKTLGSIGSTRLEFNPVHDDAFALRQWFDDQGGNIKSTSLSKSDFGPGGGAPSEQKTFQQVKDENIGQNGSPKFFQRGTVTFIKHDGTFSYNACPECKKKVTESGDGQWRCENCNKNFPEPNPRYILNITACDNTSSIRANCFDEVGQVLLSRTAGELHAMKDSNDESSFEASFSQACFKTYNFVFRSKYEVYEGEGRVKHSVVDITPIDWKLESQNLLAKIKNYS